MKKWFIPLLVILLITGGVFAYSFWTYWLNFGRWESRGSGFIGANPCYSPDETKIVYASPKSGRGDIYVYSLVTKKRMQLTNHENYEGDPNWSADGKQIVFTREEKGYGNIWMMNADGSKQVQLTEGRQYDSMPCFSPDGEAVVFARQRSLFSPATSELYLLKLETSELIRLTRNYRAADWQPVVSPDGKFIAFSDHSDDIVMMNIDGTDYRIVAEGGSKPDFSPDGRKIAFTDNNKQVGSKIDIFEYDVQEKTVTTLLETEGYSTHPRYIMDGNGISYFYQPETTGRGVMRRYDLKKKKQIDEIRLE